MPRRVRIDIDGEGLGFHGTVTERVARAMLVVMTSEQARERTSASQQRLFPNGDDPDAFLKTLAGAERTLYVRGREKWGDAGAYQLVLEQREPDKWYAARLRRMRPGERRRFAELAVREGRAGAVRAMHEAALERPA